jgi:hypothetical protein
MSGDIEHRDLVARLRVANERMRRMRGDAGSADNVIRFRVERHQDCSEHLSTMVDVESRFAGGVVSLLDRSCGAESLTSSSQEVGAEVTPHDDSHSAAFEGHRGRPNA